MRLRNLLVLFVLVILAATWVLFERHNASGNALAEEVWANNEDVVRQAVQSKSDHRGGYSVDEFEKACAFFLKLTGIHLDYDVEFFGSSPNRNTARGLELVRLWYARNHKRLAWDSDSKSVEVLSPEDPAGVIWWRNERIIVDLKRGADVQIQAVEKARRFFSALTGIEIPPSENHPALGLLPGNGTEEALQALRDWYAINQSKVCVSGPESLVACG